MKLSDVLSMKGKPEQKKPQEENIDLSKQREEIENELRSQVRAPHISPVSDQPEQYNEEEFLSEEVQQPSLSEQEFYQRQQMQRPQAGVSMQRTQQPPQPIPQIQREVEEEEEERFGFFVIMKTGKALYVSFDALSRQVPVILDSIVSKVSKKEIVSIGSYIIPSENIDYIDLSSPKK